MFTIILITPSQILNDIGFIVEDNRIKRNVEEAMRPTVEVSVQSYAQRAKGRSSIMESAEVVFSKSPELVPLLTEI